MVEDFDNVVVLFFNFSKPLEFLKTRKTLQRNFFSV